MLTLGARYEWWRAYGGLNFSASPALDVEPARAAPRRAFSPKASPALAAGGRAGRVTFSAGQAYRFPTVSELYQAISTGPTLTAPDPNLKPERARSAELAVERRFAAATSGCRCSTRRSATP